MVIGCWLLVVGYWLLVIGYWLLVIGYWLLVIGYWFLFIDKSDRETFPAIALILIFGCELILLIFLKC
ncbi:MAG: hypothetical protein AB4290_31630 [Spirulina sp.]